MGNNERRPSIAIVGSGFSGLGLAVRLKRAGFTDLTIFEKAAGVGGVWRDNTYPGAACDAPSHLYSYSFRPNPDWSRRFAEQPEILGYLQDCASDFGLEPHLRYRTEIVSARYDPAARHWVLTARDGERTTADVLVAACGQLSRPAVPQIPGLEHFTGTVFHSARWDHDCDFRDRDVAVVGTGASAIQFVPHVAGRARSLTVFQRQAHWLGPKPDREYSRLRKLANRRFPLLQRLPRLGVFLCFEALLNPMLISPYGRRLLGWPIRRWCHHHRREIRDPALRAALEPRYELGCNRILASSDYFETLNRGNTHVVTQPITRIEARAVRTADGGLHRADTIILATGFRSHDFVAPMRVEGLDGADLTTTWQRRPRAYLGLTVPRFPNFFLMYGPNTNVGSGSIVHMLESQMNYIVDAVEQVARTGYLEVRAEVFDRFQDTLHRRLSTTVWNTGGCHSWYVTEADGRPLNTNNWSGSMYAYRRRTRRLALAEYHTTPAAAGER
ncbi:flavin-containing monooxygenase [Nocardia aurantia]|uniref:Baeyer-Villiger monooxygenase n=1 Tax=Nocardia aurantia TaxID=2585199 RepID=A0A7K0DNZ9_9NOCA|nr:NAD(P)/FAD-dependent oxidoreductase [Nocardia aurantia]MQY27475.1 Baeyer-Villiger monooxygenase [Nocardia aurantia]